MEENRPHLIVLAGPNGAGKSTTAPLLLAGTLQVQEFVNADVIAQGLSAFQPEQVALEAGRIMLRRLHDLAGQRVNFAFESILSGRSFAPWIAELRSTGYVCYLNFLWLPNVDLALARVAERVRLGGHNVPAETVRRRYQAGLRNFFRLYRPLADLWYFYDNSGPSGPRLLADGKCDRDENVHDQQAWSTAKMAGENG
jgi:predicted ABC-type ATPase